MECTKRITEDLYWVGASDRRIALFENVFPVANGVSYNAYLLKDEKTTLFDTVDHSVSRQFFENLDSLLAGRPLDYLVISHMEPDHGATLAEVLRRWPNVRLYASARAFQMVNQFFGFDPSAQATAVKEGDTLSTGRHTLHFVMAPMVHWPEVMVTYDETDKVLFSADAFGTFGALSGNLFADEVEFERDWLSDARRYYTNIVGKYGTQVQALLKKAAALDIAYLCPLHGPVWRSKIDWFVRKYNLWSTYTPEESAVLIAYASVYGDTENAVTVLAGMLAERGARNIRMYDVSKTDPDVLVAEAFRCSHLVLASTTYNAGIFCKMETFLHDLAEHNIQNRTVAVIENGSWAPTAGRLITEIMVGCKNMTILDESVSIRSALKPAQKEELAALADALTAAMPKPAVLAADPARIVEPEAFFRLSYGLFVLSAREGERDNGCIVNTVLQITDTPKRIAVAVNKNNLTHDMIARTGVLNVSILSTAAPFAVFQAFGFASGRTTDKFAGRTDVHRSANGLTYLEGCANAYLSAHVTSTQEFETHTVFFVEVTEAKVLSSEPSVTYEYYFANIKPKPQPAPEKKKGWVCRICGYVYEGETLPPDFTCPLCGHGADDFEPLS